MRFRDRGSVHAYERLFVQVQCRPGDVLLRPEPDLAGTLRAALPTLTLRLIHDTGNYGGYLYTLQPLEFLRPRLWRGTEFASASIECATNLSQNFDYANLSKQMLWRPLSHVLNTAAAGFISSSLRQMQTATSARPITLCNSNFVPE